MFPNHASFPKAQGALLGLLLALAVAGISGASWAQESRFVDPERPWLAEGDSLISIGDAESALDSYRGALEAHPEDAQLWLRISAVQVAIGQPAEGLEAATRARQLDPNGPEPYVMMAQAQFAMGDGRTALRTLEDGVAQHPDDIPLLEALTTVKIGTGQWGAAAGLLRQLILLSGENPMYYMDLGRIQHRAGEMQDAYTTLRRALELGAPRAETLALLGHVTLAIGRLEEARGYLEESLSLEPSAEGWSGIAGVDFLEGKVAEAEQGFRRALELEPRDADTWFNLGNSIVVQERAAEAESAFRRAIELDPGPSSAAARLNLGVLLLTRQSVQEAEEQFQTAISVNPALPGPYLHMARIAGSRFDFATARRYYEQYQDAVPDTEEKARIQLIIADLDQRLDEKDEAQARGEVHLLQIMTATHEEASSAYTRVEGGEDFYAVGEDVSRLASVTGVDIGFVDPAGLSEGFRVAISSLEVGQTTKVLEGPNGWFLFQRVE